MYTTFTTRNRDIAEKLSKKLELNTSQDKEQPDHSILDAKYKEATEKLKIFKTKNQRHQLQIAQDVERVQDILFTIQRSKNKNNDISTQLFESLEKFVQYELATNSQKMTVVRKGMIEDLEKKKKAMKTDAIQIIQQQFEDICKANLMDVQKKTNMLITMIEEQKAGKDQSASYLAQTIGQEILKMQQMIVQERESRKSQNQSILDLISEIQDKFDGQIKEEVKLREKSQQYIESRLEEICFKIQHKILGN